MDVKKLSANIFLVFNVSVALSCAFWLMLIRQCSIDITYGIGGGIYKVQSCPSYLEYLAKNGYVDRIDFFFVIDFYLIFLFLTIAFFLFAKERWIEKIKNWKFFFLTINIVFAAFLFFEV